jgi:hypothetical protein
MRSSPQIAAKIKQHPATMGIALEHSRLNGKAHHSASSCLSREHGGAEASFHTLRVWNDDRVIFDGTATFKQHLLNHANMAEAFTSCTPTSVHEVNAAQRGLDAGMLSHFDIPYPLRTYSIAPFKVVAADVAHLDLELRRVDRIIGQHTALKCLHQNSTVDATHLHNDPVGLRQRLPDDVPPVKKRIGRGDIPIFLDLARPVHVVPEDLRNTKAIDALRHHHGRIGIGIGQQLSPDRAIRCAVQLLVGTIAPIGAAIDFAQIAIQWKCILRITRDWNSCRVALLVLSVANL